MSLTIEPAYAYLGPGAGLSAIGSLVALVAAVLFAIVGFLWYPIKRFIKSNKKKSENISNTQDEPKKEE